VATVSARCHDADAALTGAARIRGAGVDPIALEVTRVEGGWLIAIRLEGREATVRELLGTVTDLLKSADIEEPESIDGTASGEWWQRYVARQSPSAESTGVLIRCAVRPRATAELLRALRSREAHGVVAFHTMQVSPSLGLVHTRMSGPSGDDGGDWLSRVLTDLLAVSENATVLAAPPAWKRGLDVWGRTPETLDVMRALKEQFDPNRVLNPGRFAGFL
jgi:glycolate oxidase FAD binding subunit